jgi:hypothetical protein
MRRLIVLLLLLVLPVTACTFEFQTFPNGEQTPAPSPSLVPATEVGAPGNEQNLEGPNINYKGIRFTLDPALGSRLYAFDEVIAIDSATAHYTRFALNPEEYCQTWCLMVYLVPEFEQAFGSFVFPPHGYRGGSAVIFNAQEKPLSFQNGSGDRGLETFGQDHYGASNEALKYVFRGYSADRQYGVYLQVPTRAANLPDTAPAMTTNVDEILQYNQQAADAMNALTPADFMPNLDVLDALVASIQVGAP